MPHEDRIPRRHRATRLAVAGLWTGALLLQIGCYSYLPVQSAPPVAQKADQQVALVINDRGRTLLAERVGPLVDQIEGRIDKRENGMLQVAVFKVKDVRGNISTWTGEQVMIPEEAVLGYRPRKVSKFKTALLVGAIVLAVITTLKTSFDIFGTPPTDRGGDEPSQS